MRTIMMLLLLAGTAHGQLTRGRIRAIDSSGAWSTTTTTTTEDALTRAVKAHAKLDTIVRSSSYYGATQTTRFIFLKKDYRKAAQISQLAMIPYQGLNDKARRELDEGWRYILRMESVP